MYLTTMRGIMIGDLNGNLISSFGTRGPKPGQVDFPTGIVVDGKGNIYVADSMNYRVQAFNQEGKSLWTYGKGPDPKNILKDRNRTFGLPVSLAMDNDNILYVMDGLGGEVFILDNKGKQLDKVGDWGHSEGQFYYPEGIAYAGNETFVIADKFNDRVQVLRIPSPIVTPLQRVSGYGLPIIALAALVGLVLWLLRRRALHYVLDEAFLREALNRGYAASLLNELGKVYVTDLLYEQYKDVEENGIKLGELLKPKGFASELAETMAKEHNLSDEEAGTLTLAKETKGKVVVLTESSKVLETAQTYDLVAKRYDDLVEMESEEAAGSPA
jgi:hypothetical protein